MLSLGRRGSTAVDVLAVRWLRPMTYLVRDSRGCQYNAGARQLSPCPVTDGDGNLLCYAHEGLGQ